MHKRIGFFAVAAVAAMAVATQDTVLLRRELKENAVENYKVTIDGMQNMDIPMMGPTDMGIKGSYDWIFKTKTIDKEKKVAEVDLVVRDMKLELTGPMAEMANGQMPQMPKEVVSPVKLDERYRMTDSKPVGANMQLMMAMGAGAGMNPFIEFPETAVKPGDSWTVTLPKNPMLGNVEHKLKATFKGEGSLEKQAGYHIVLEGSIPLNVDLSKAMEEMAKSGNDPSGGMAAGMAMTLKGTMTSKIDMVVAKTGGQILASVMTIGSDTVTTINETMNLTSKGTMTLKMIVQPPAN